MKITSINKQNHAILTLENIVNRANKSGNRMGEEGGGNERQGGLNMGGLSQIKMNSIDYHYYANFNDPEKISYTTMETYGRRGRRGEKMGGGRGRRECTSRGKYISIGLGGGA